MTAHRVTSVFWFPPEVISIAVRWCLRYELSYRDAGERLAERGITVNHVTACQWAQRFIPEFIEAARPCRHALPATGGPPGGYGKAAGKWTYLYRATGSTARSPACCYPGDVTWARPGGS